MFGLTHRIREFVYQTAKKIPKLKVTYGTDLFLLPEEGVAESVKQMERLLPWYTPGEILKMATSNAGELFKMSGLRNPYPDGDLGVVKEGAYADLLLVEGNPLEDLSAVTDKQNLKVIMRDGRINATLVEGITLSEAELQVYYAAPTVAYQLAELGRSEFHVYGGARFLWAQYTAKINLSEPLPPGKRESCWLIVECFSR